MAQKKPKLPEYLTPKCVAAYPKLLVPDTKFKDDGEFSVKLAMTATDAEAIRANAEAQMKPYIVADIEAAEKVLAEAKPADKPKKKKALEARKAAAATAFSMSIDDQLDSAGIPTGNKIVTFKQKAVIKFKDKDGSEVRRNVRIPLFDARGNAIQTHDAEGKLLSNAIRIYSGTEMKIRYQIIPAYIVSNEVYWASLRPVAGQIISLVSEGSAKDASAYGFGAEEGYEASASTESDKGDTGGAAGY